MHGVCYPTNFKILTLAHMTHFHLEHTDAYNLAWKLALVLNGHAGNELLETYEQERIPVADDVIKMSSGMFTMGFSHTLIRRAVRRVLIGVASYIVKWITIPPGTVSMVS